MKTIVSNFKISLRVFYFKQLSLETKRLTGSPSVLLSSTHQLTRLPLVLSSLCPSFPSENPCPSLPLRLVLGFMCCTVFLSMWLSNTSTTAMVMPIAEAVLQQLICTGLADSHNDSETADTTEDESGTFAARQLFGALEGRLNCFFFFSVLHL